MSARPYRVVLYLRPGPLGRGGICTEWRGRFATVEAAEKVAVERLSITGPEGPWYDRAAIHRRREPGEAMHPVWLRVDPETGEVAERFQRSEDEPYEAWGYAS